MPGCDAMAVALAVTAISFYEYVRCVLCSQLPLMFGCFGVCSHVCFCWLKCPCKSGFNIPRHTLSKCCYIIKLESMMKR